MWCGVMWYGMIYSAGFAQSRSQSQSHLYRIRNPQSKPSTYYHLSSPPKKKKKKTSPSKLIIILPIPLSSNQPFNLFSISPPNKKKKKKKEEEEDKTTKNLN